MRCSTTRIETCRQAAAEPPKLQVESKMHFHFTQYFETQVLRKRPYLRKAWRIAVVENPVRYEPQEHNRFRFWGAVPELGGRYLRVRVRRA